MAGVMMTEVVAYPVSLWAVVAVHHAATRPGRRADLLAMGALALAFFARTQLIVMWGALPVALVAQRLRYPHAAAARPTRRWRALLAEHWPVFAAGALVAVVALVKVKALVGDAPHHLQPRLGGGDARAAAEPRAPRLRGDPARRRRAADHPGGRRQPQPDRRRPARAGDQRPLSVLPRAAAGRRDAGAAARAPAAEPRRARWRPRRGVGGVGGQAGARGPDVRHPDGDLAPGAQRLGAVGG